MSLSKRIQLYKKIEQERGRPLIAYVTSQRANASGQMGADVVPEICDQVLALPQKTQAVDILIVSSGGDPMVAWRTISVLREKVKTIGVLIPQSAYSAATLLALGADEIVMHPCGNLGPLDPQITINHRDAKGNNEAIQYSAEDLLAFLNFAKKEVGIELSVAKKVISGKSDSGFVVEDQYCEIPTISGESIYLTIIAMEIV